CLLRRRRSLCRAPPPRRLAACHRPGHPRRRDARNASDRALPAAPPHDRLEGDRFRADARDRGHRPRLHPLLRPDLGRRRLARDPDHLSRAHLRGCLRGGAARRAGDGGGDRRPRPGARGSRPPTGCDPRRPPRAASLERDLMSRVYVPYIAALAALWGASYMFIKVADRAFEPATMIMFRLVISA